jgi:hypothetical protein
MGCAPLGSASSIAKACSRHHDDSPHVGSSATMVYPQRGNDLMSNDLSKEFESYRSILPSEEDKHTFDRRIKQLLEQRGVDYVRGYVDALKETILK